MKTAKKYKNHPQITASPVDEPAEYQRQYYWLVLRGKRKVPPKIIRKKRKKK